MRPQSIVAASLPPPSIAAHITGDLAFQIVGITLTVLITIIGIRMVLYWTSFAFQPSRYRQRVPVSTTDLKKLSEHHHIPNLKVQFTTKGSPGSSEVITRGIRQLELLANEDPGFYRQFLTVEVVTENAEQSELISRLFAYSSLGRVDCVTTPENYRTPKGTQLKAKQMHYLVELRRAGWNQRPGRTFIVHLDEDTLMVPEEFRKMAKFLTLTDKKVLTGPIYYPLEYDEATRLARATEATRPITCFECRRVMETGVPLHVHGSNLVVEEELENRLGWDIGTLDGVPFVAEDYMFGMDTFLKEGSDVFGWHGCVAWEQPPFSFPSVYRQRYRWVFGVLQGMSVSTVLPEFHHLPWHLRMKVIWGTRYRIATYALGTLVGAMSLIFLPFALLVTGLQLHAGEPAGVSPWLDGWFCLVGIMWLGANVMGAWMNALHTGRTGAGLTTEVFRAVALSPVAGFMENMAAMSAVVKWMVGIRGMEWHSTPSTKEADDALRGRTEIVQRPLAETVVEAVLPSHSKVKYWSLAILTITGIAIICAYIGVPALLVVQDIVETNAILVPAILAGALITLIMMLLCARVSKLTEPDLTSRGYHRQSQATIPVSMSEILSAGQSPYDDTIIERLCDTEPFRVAE